MKILSFLIATLLSTGALAQNQVIITNKKNQDVTESANLPMYISLELNKSSVTTDNLNFSGYGIKIGQYMSNNLSVEFSYNSLIHIHEIDLSQNHDRTAKFNTMDVGINYYVFNKKGFKPKLKVGLSRNYGEMYGINYGKPVNISKSTIEPYFGLGFEYDMNQDIAIYADYTSYP